jgi:hypothetical protein
MNIMKIIILLEQHYGHKLKTKYIKVILILLKI